MTVRKIERQQINKKQQEAYYKFMDYIENRKAKFKEM
jgi:hypothetical protein